MTTSTIFSSVPVDQNAGGYPPIPTPSVINAGAPVNKHSFTLTVTPTTGWAKAAVRAGLDGVNYPRGSEVFVAPNTGGLNEVSAGGSMSGPWQYFSGEVIEVSPGCAATLTVTF